MRLTGLVSLKSPADESIESFEKTALDDILDRVAMMNRGNVSDYKIP